MNGVRAYLDHCSTSPLRPEAFAAMVPYLTEHFGNPSGSHSTARRARAAVDDAREQVAEVMGCAPGDIVFCGGGTESCNLAVIGATRARPDQGALCSAVEHHAVLLACAAAAGHTVAVDHQGVIDLDALADALHLGVGFVSVMAANNEVGTVQPFDAVARLVRERAPGALLHTDAVAAASTDLAALVALADLVSIAGHKFGGPKGVGALVMRGAPALSPALFGGPQERDRRPGTHDVAGIVGMAAALEVTSSRRREETPRVSNLRDRLVEGITREVPGATETVVGPDGRRPPVLPGTAHMLFRGIDQEELLLLMDDSGVEASAGAACASGAIEPSHVLLAMGLAPSEARGAVRFSLGWSTTDVEVEHAIQVVAKAAAQLRGTGGR